MKNDKYSKWDDSIAHTMDCLTEDGHVMKLEGDVLLYFKLGATEQGALERLGRCDDKYADEIDRMTGMVLLGEPEELREHFHDIIDELFAHIYEVRGILTKEQVHRVNQGTTLLDDALDEEVEVEDATQ